MVRLILLLILILLVGLAPQLIRAVSFGEASKTAPETSGPAEAGAGLDGTAQIGRETPIPQATKMSLPATPRATSRPTKAASIPSRTPRAEDLRPDAEDDQVETCKWTSVFYDDFESGELDPEKWNPDYKAGQKEAQHYVDDAFEFKDGNLLIRAEERSKDGRDYTSGIITTQGIFDQKYGWFEIRAKVPHGKGLWPAFWLLPSSKNYPYEIDVFEILGDDTRTVYMSNHWPDDRDEHVYKTESFTGPDFSEDFHIFAVDWKPDRITWVVDGVERASTEQGLPDDAMFLLINLAVGGEWPGYPDAATEFPSFLEVDYVRVVAEVCP